MREGADRTVVALPEPAHVVAKPAVPLLPGVADEAADLIEPRRVPGFRDQLGAGEQGIRLDVHHDRRIGQRIAAFVARENRREIEAEPVDVHLGNPVAEAVLDHPADDRLVGVERVAAARVVGVLRPVVLKDVVELVGQPAITLRRAVRARFRRVVVDDVEDHFDAGAMQRLHHVAELVERTERIGRRAVGVMRREERYRLVAPVVHAAGRGLRIELLDRQELDGCNAEVLQIGDFLDQAGIGAALLLGTPELGWRVKPRTCSS